MFANFLDATVQIADHALEAENFFAIQAKNDAQHAVRGGMLRAHVDDEFVGIKKRLLVEFRDRDARASYRSVIRFSVAVLNEVLFTGRFQCLG